MLLHTIATLLLVRNHSVSFQDVTPVFMNTVYDPVTGWDGSDAGAFKGSLGTAGILTQYQYLCSRQIICNYAFKKKSDAEGGGEAGGAGGAGGPMERHGSQAEWMLAASNPMHKYLQKSAVQRMPNTMFATIY